VVACGEGNKVGFLVNGKLLRPPGLLMSIAPCNKVCEAARQRIVMIGDGGME
jgi:hypothetical protein